MSPEFDPSLQEGDLCRGRQQLRRRRGDRRHRPLHAAHRPSPLHRHDPAVSGNLEEACDRFGDFTCVMCMNMPDMRTLQDLTRKIDNLSLLAEESE